MIDEFCVCEKPETASENSDVCRKCGKPVKKEAPKGITLEVQNMVIDTKSIFKKITGE